MKRIVLFLKRFPVHLVLAGVLLGYAARFCFPPLVDDLPQPKFDKPVLPIQDDETIDLPII